MIFINTYPLLTETYNPCLTTVTVVKIQFLSEVKMLKSPGVPFVI